MPDSSWKDLAEGSRDALGQLGYVIEPRCLPGEPDDCGGTYAQHVMAQLAAIKAVADHHLTHLGELAAFHGDIYWKVRGEVTERCGTHE